MEPRTTVEILEYPEYPKKGGVEMETNEKKERKISDVRDTFIIVAAAFFILDNLILIACNI